MDVQHIKKIELENFMPRYDEVVANNAPAISSGSILKPQQIQDYSQQINEQGLLEIL